MTFCLKYAAQAFLVTVRNKKRVGYTYELTIDVKGWYLRLCRFFSIFTLACSLPDNLEQVNG